MGSERLQKVMARAGIASRRKCETIIEEGRVTVDDQVICEPGFKVDPVTQTVMVDGKPLEMPKRAVFLLNKPRGVVSSVSDPQGRPTVVSLLEKEGLSLYPVGRLDFNTSGALLLTNDGALAHALTHPSMGAQKQYLVKFRGVVSEVQMDAWRKGVTLEDGSVTQPVVRIARVDESDGGTWVHVVLKEGKNRQIRRMADATGMQISKLKRISVAGVSIEGLPVGHYRPLTSSELATLASRFQLTPHSGNANFVSDDAMRPRKSSLLPPPKKSLSPVRTRDAKRSPSRTGRSKRR